MNAKDNMDELKVVNVSDTVSREEYEAMKDSYLRLAADFDNFRKRIERDRERIEGMATLDAVCGLLPIIDDIERACEQSSDSEGFSLIYSKLQVYLREMAVADFGNEGEQFDSELHEALMTTNDGEVDKGCISRVLKRGYKIRLAGSGDEEIIRHAQVAVEQ